MSKEQQSETDARVTGTLWGSADSDTRIFWDTTGGINQGTVFGNAGPMPINNATYENCAKLAEAWNLHIIDHK